MNTTESVAHALIEALDNDDDSEWSVPDEPTDDVRSGGSFFDVENAAGERFTVLVVAEGA